MGKLKKDISSSVYLQFVNKIWKNTSTCCTCTIRNGECVIIAQKGKCKAFRSQNTTHPRVCGLQYPPKVDISNQHNPQGWAYRWHCGSSAFRPDAISAPTTVPGNPSGSPRFRDT